MKLQKEKILFIPAIIFILIGMIIYLSVANLQTADDTVKAVCIIVFAAAVLILEMFYWSLRHQRKERRYRMALFNGIAESINAVVLMYDCSSGKNEIVFENIERILGVSYAGLQELAEKEEFQRKYAGSAFAEIIGRRNFKLKQHGSEKLEWDNPRTGQKQWLRIEAVLLDLMGVQKCVVSIVDFTQEELLQDSLRTAALAAKKANEVKSEFLSRMSHDIRTPMNAIVGMNQIAKTRLQQGGDVDECLDKIAISSNQLLALINDVLDISKIESGKMAFEEIWFSLDDLVRIITSTIGFQASQKEQEFHVTAKNCENVELLGDSLRLSQVLMNLLGNAVKYTQRGGEINFTIRSVPTSEAGYRQYTFEISDNGYGMSEEFQQRMFTPFERETNELTKGETGTGLGLSIVHNIVSLMGGFIQVKSAPRKGTTFCVDIGFHTNETVPAQHSEKALCEPTDLSGYRILLAEDNELNREIAVEFLEMVHAEVICAENGKETYELFKNSEEGTIDVILMDMQMPVWDGLEATRRIRSLERTDSKSVLIIAATANAFMEDEKRCIDAGMDDYITKPLDMQTLYRKIMDLSERTA